MVFMLWLTSSTTMTCGMARVMRTSGISTAISSSTAAAIGSASERAEISLVVLQALVQVQSRFVVAVLCEEIRAREHRLGCEGVLLADDRAGDDGAVDARRLEPAPAVHRGAGAQQRQGGPTG